MEFIKELDDDDIHLVTDTLNHWWTTEKLDTDTLIAKVVLIHKKDSKEDFNNYRPISLLNTLYKILAIIIQNRISDGLDVHLQATQYGFRKKRGTADALQHVRRMVEKGESTTFKTLLVLLDWEKAFDEISHEALIHTHTHTQKIQPPPK